ncbi:hypothetical protein Tco_0624846 [Tanacetum coccineum]|uniref:Uncharacterized protein n=1 Tax=Tanacetum coccineum TaxID=301880 RepID=A0ABQ4WF48_9ASTR
MSTPVFVDPEISTQADEAQSSRVPVPLPKDPYEAIRQAYLVGTNTESKPFEGEAEAPESPHTVASPTSLPDSTPPTCHVEESEGSDTSGARSMSSNSTGDVARPLCQCDLPSRKRYRGTSELVEDDNEEGDDEQEDEEMEESSDSDSVSEDAEDEGPTIEDEDPAVGDEGLAAGDEGPGMGVESLSLGGDEAVPVGQQRAAPVAETAMGEPLGLGYRALRHREIAWGEGWMPSVFEVDPEDGIVYIDVPAYPPPAPPAQTPPSPEWSSGSLPISPAPSIVPSPISSPMISLTVPSPVASPATAETGGFLTELGARVEIQGGLIHDHTSQGEIFSRVIQRYRFRSLEHEQERVAVTFGAIWRPVLALESWAGQTDAQRAALWHAISDTQGENQELQLQLAKERRVRLELAEIFDSMRRGQEPKGDV